MKFYLNWLKEYVDIDIQPSEIAAKLALAGVEVSECKQVGVGFENVVTAEILKIRKHPNADKLSVCQVSNGREILSVVCGASNIKEKDKVPLAMDGAVLPGGVKITKSKLRGEVSCGMLCSAKELQIGGDESGIYILPKETPLGRDLCEYLNLKNWKFELETAPNRGDLLGIIGVAREVGAITRRKVKMPQVPADDGKKRSMLGDFSVEILEPELCPRYTAAIMHGIKVAESPDWLKKHLEETGVRPVNNIVDVTNFVMMELGQPLHAFDLAKISGRKIVVRRVKPGEKIKTLDGVQRNLDPMDLAICDFSRPVAVAGVMGGFESEIGPETKDILIESACFDPRSIRKTARRLGLSSESSYRFERGVDILGTRNALLRSVSLLEKIGAGKWEPGIIDVCPEEYKHTKIVFKSAKVKRVLGLEIAPAKIKEILEGLGMDVKNYGDVDFEVAVPSFRSDIKEDTDLIEEVARLHGYHLIPTTLPETLAEPEFFEMKETTVETIKGILTGAGYFEVRNYSFIPEKDNALFLGSDPALEGEVLKIQNPLTPDQAVMRQSIVPSMLRNIAYHKMRQIENLKLFEIDKTFHIFSHQCTERMSLVAAISGRKPDRWDSKGRKFDFYDIKGIAEEIMDRLSIGGVKFRARSSKRYLHPKISCEMMIGEKAIGCLGIVHPDILNRYELDEVYLLEISVDEILNFTGKKFEFKPYSKFPAVKRDISITVDESVQNDEVIALILGSKPDFLTGVSLFDHYKGNQVPDGKKSLSYNLLFQSSDRTLTEAEVDKVQDKILGILSANLKAELRK